MTRPRTAQERMDAAFDNYFQLSEILGSDLDELLKIANGDQQWRRNFIRATAALFEGYAHCLREMCAVSFECEAPALTKEENDVLRSEEDFRADDRIRLTLRAAYKLFQVVPAPNFGGREWPKARLMLAKRHLLMHPRTPSDLIVVDESWAEIHEGAEWMLRQFFGFFDLLQQKYILQTR